MTIKKEFSLQIPQKHCENFKLIEMDAMLDSLNNGNVKIPQHTNISETVFHFVEK